MFEHKHLQSVWWQLRVGLGVGVKLRLPALSGRLTRKAWHNRAVRVVSQRHRYLPGHRMRTGDGNRRPA